MSLLWQKEGVEIDARIQRFLAGDDVANDRHLFLYDVAASRAHVEGLARIGILHADEARELATSLDELAEAYRDGAFVLDERYEDGHSAIEAHLVAEHGDLGRKVHTGRSRNDQVLVALRLLYRDTLAKLDALAREAAHAFLDRAEADRDTPMPGYTHLQRAVPSSVGFWMAAFAESMLDDAELARQTRRFLDRSPLGTAAGYGVNLPLDREGVARALGFESLQWNPMAAQNSRGKWELVLLSTLGAALLDVRRFAWDLSLFTTSEFAFVQLPERHTTGSSIMPNKRNPDVVELLRAAYATVAGAEVEIASVLSLPSGYQRDLQATKGPTIRAIRGALAAMEIFPDVVRSFAIDREKMRAAIGPETYATDRAVEMAVAGVPFRTAYREMAKGAGDGGSPEESLRKRVSPGAHADLGLDRLRVRLAELER